MFTNTHTPYISGKGGEVYGVDGIEWRGKRGLCTQIREYTPKSNGIRHTLMVGGSADALSMLFFKRSTTMSKHADTLTTCEIKYTGKLYRKTLHSEKYPTPNNRRVATRRTVEEGCRVDPYELRNSRRPNTHELNLYTRFTKSKHKHQTYRV